MTGRALLWFRRDLRLVDHPALLAAGSDGNVVIPVFVVDPRFDAAGAPRRAVLHDVLRGLDRDLRERYGSRLIIRIGDPTVEIPHLANELDADAVFVSHDAGPYGRERDRAVDAALADAGRALRSVGSPYAVEPGSVVKADGTSYRVFTPYSKMWRSAGWPAPFGAVDDDVEWISQRRAAPWCHPIFERPEPDCELPELGETAALERWASFIDARTAADGSDRSGVAAYGTLRDRPDLDGTSRLSVDLKWGTIHPRTLLADLDLTDAGAEAFAKELAWRDFAADVLWREPGSVDHNLNPLFHNLPVDTDQAARQRFAAWCRGHTGFGIVDAGMRQLAATGWMHNRVRMVTASFLVKDLHLPWQWGARWFMEHLVDGDVASNSHGWQWTAGTGTDAAPYFRVFSPDAQQERYDPHGDYVARWVPSPVEPMLDHRAERLEALERLRWAKAQGVD